MIEAIKFTSDEFDETDDNNLINPMTDNLIILCESSEIKNIISDKIEKLNDFDGPDYGSHDRGVADIKKSVRYRPTSIYMINGDEQRIVVTVEDPFVLTAKKVGDIWFASDNGSGKIEIYPMFAFKGHEEVWDEGIYKVYTTILSGVFGNFGKYGR